MANWYLQNGKDSDVVVSTRVRLVRNLKGFKFVNKSSKEEQEKILNTVKDIVPSLGFGLKYIDLDDLDDVTKLSLVEKHLISPEFAINNSVKKAVIMNSEENISIMLNEDDHIKLQVFSAGQELENLTNFIIELDEKLGNAIDYAYSKKIGYLSSSPINVGTGMEASVIVHLPALTLTGNLSKVLRIVNNFGMSIKGVNGEGTQNPGDLYQIANNQTIGITEKEIMASVRDITEKIIEQAYTLIITVDCGISGIEEIEECSKIGIDTIVTDHHEQGDILPNAYAVIDAKRKDNKYPFRDLAGVGIVFKLIQAISIKLNLDDKEYLKYLDIVAVGTISDIVPLIDENRVIAKLGLKLIEVTKNVGLRELIISSNYKKINSNTISFGIAPRINACGRMGYQEEALKLFLTENIIEAKEITKKLNKYNLERQEKEGNIFKQAIEKLKLEKIENMDVIVLGDDNWYHGVIGIVASKLTEAFFKPTILVCFEDNQGKGSGRSIPNFDLYEALKYCSDYLEKFGGHEMAVGLTIKKENFEKFKAKFEEIAKQNNVSQIIPKLKIDAEISKNDLRLETVDELKKLEPFGEKNEKPYFIYKGLKISSIRALSEGKHLKLSLRDGNQLIDAIGFNLGNLADEYLIGDKVDIVGMLEINEYNGTKKIQINLKDIMKSI